MNNLKNLYLSLDGNQKTIILLTILTILTPIILSIINNKKNNKIHLENKKTEDKQIKLSIKPELLLVVPSLEKPSTVEQKNIFESFGRPDHYYFLENNSENIAYDVEITTLIYLSNQGWKEYYELKQKKIDRRFDIQKQLNEKTIFFKSNRYQKDYTKISPGNITSANEIDFLKKNNVLYNTIPSNFFNLDIEQIKFKPDVFIFVRYRDKEHYYYEDCHKLIIINHDSITAEGFFQKEVVDSKKIKDKLFEQKKYLNEDFPNPIDIFYYNIKE